MFVSVGKKTMVKKKMPFIILSAFFGALSLLIIFFTWGNSHSTTIATSMMTQSMGEMMIDMHVSDVTVRELILQQEKTEAASATENQASHHSQGGFLKTAHYLTTGTIVILLPFILAGTVFLAIIWFSKPSEVKR